jgi:hypothetical protein
MSKSPRKPPTQRIGFGVGTHPLMNPESWQDQRKSIRVVIAGQVIVLPAIR